MKKLAIIGASYLQLPLIRKAKDMGLEAHVFAWECGDVGEKEADFFYPISIVEKDLILEKCKAIGIDGICTIASDLAVITVNYVAQNLGLLSNSLACTSKSTNKNLMRKCFEINKDPSPKSKLISSVDDKTMEDFKLPVIIKPTDRSGSRGIYKVTDKKDLKSAIENASKEGFENKVLIEEFAEGTEYSVECISCAGIHQLLQITYKYTTGAPHFIETGHLEPAPLKDETFLKIKETVFHALDSLDIQYGASHSELKIDDNGNIKIIEIGGRMGGDFIGSDLVVNSTGYDFIKGVIDVSLGKKPDIFNPVYAYSAVRFIFSKDDLNILESIKKEHPEILSKYEVIGNVEDEITDSSNRHGYYITKSNNKDLIYKYLSSEPIEK